MRLLSVIRSINPAHGGLAEGLRQSVLASRAMGDVHDVVTLDSPDDPWVRPFPSATFALGPAASNYGYVASLLPWLERRAPHYDAVIVQGLWQYPGWAVWRALRDGPVPYFVFTHGMLDPWFKQEYPLKHLKKWLYWPWAEYRVLRDASAVLFTSEEESRLAPQSFWMYRACPAVVGYGLELESSALMADAKTFYTAFPATHGKRVLLFLSRIHPKKGCDLLIDAFAKEAARDPALHLVMAGPDQVGWQAALAAQAQRLGVADRITWCGMLEGDLKWAALRAADAFVLPSHQENFGVAVVEALALGVPVLISEKVNIWREIVGANAGFADQDTAAGTEATLRRWLGLDDVRRAGMRRAAAACYRRHFHRAAAAKRVADAIAPHTRAAAQSEAGSRLDSQP